MLYECHPYLRLKDDTVITDNIFVEFKQQNGVYTVFFHGFSNKPLNMDFGAGIEFEIPGISEWMADYRKCEYWCRPEFGKDLSEVPDETQGFIYKKTDGSYGVILPMVSEKYKCVLKGNENNSLTARIFSWYDKICTCDAPVFVCAEGKNPFELLEKCAETGMKILNNGCRTRKQRRYPEIFEYLGWCSWDAMQIRVNEDGLLNKCREFKEKNIPVCWIMIDDMWGYIKNFRTAKYSCKSEMMKIMLSSPLSSFEADSIRFPNGLKGCIEKIKKFGLRVGIWHPTTGYWFGIDPDSELFDKLKDLLIQADDGRWLHDFRQDKAYLFYSKFHDFLKSCGIDFIKIDNQSITRRFYRNKAPVGIAAKSYHDAMEASVGQHFDNCMINCMGMASEDMWNRAVSPVSRCSGDFQPENREWFLQHITQCTFNSLIQGQFYYSDYDMWWTNDSQGIKNSILRAVSGGPIYISDKTGSTKTDVLLPLILSDGKILRCDRPGMPSADCLTVSPFISGKPFKVQNICGYGGVIAVFNLNKGPALGTVSPSDIEGIVGERFAVYDYFKKDCIILNRNDSFAITLKDTDDFKLYTVSPLIEGFAPIGRTDKYISLKTVKNSGKKFMELYEDGPYAYVMDEKLIFKNQQA